MDTPKQSATERAEAVVSAWEQALNDSEGRIADHRSLVAAIATEIQEAVCETCEKAYLEGVKDGFDSGGCADHWTAVADWEGSDTRKGPAMESQT